MTNLELETEGLVPVHAERLYLVFGEGGRVETGAVAQAAADDGVEKWRALELAVRGTDQNLSFGPATLVEGLARARRALQDLCREVHSFELCRVPCH